MIQDKKLYLKYTKTLQKLMLRKKRKESKEVK